ncbi:MAG: DNA polymerase IV [Chloroflexota bacterium]|nr:DNA polymerase IV [Chloroflexota bacterium]MDE2946936.1 DNA polymerase IV [Chloroflexota bacterium]
MAKTRKILHLDLDAFFCAVEEQLNPELRGKAIAVGGQPDERGVVASASYPARAYGVRSAMPMGQALRLCPHLVVVGATRGVYGQRSKAVMAILRDTAPDVEPLSIDEAFLDVTILPEPIETIARKLQKRINAELELPCSLGGATNKLLAKTANTVGKARQPTDKPPNAITIVPPGAEASFLVPLPIQRLWGVGPKNAETLSQLGLTTVGDVANWSEAALTARLGKLGADIWRRAQGIDFRPVMTEHEAKSISKEVTFARDVADEAALKLTLRRLSDGVGRQARKAGVTGTTVKIKLRWTDFTTLNRQVTLDQPTDMDGEIYALAARLFDQIWVEGRPVRLIGVGLGGFSQPNKQMGLWEDREGDGQAEELQSALDRLRDRFGETMITRASDLHYRPSEDNKR